MITVPTQCVALGPVQCTYNQELALAKIQQKKYRKTARLSKQKDLGNYHQGKKGEKTKYAADKWKII
jgi:hypothetical protein